jgi:hypothetical protein
VRQRVGAQRGRRGGRERKRERQSRCGRVVLS